MNAEADPKACPVVAPTTDPESTRPIEHDVQIAVSLAYWMGVAGRLQANHAVARAALATGIFGVPTVIELEQRRRPSDRPCPRHCDRCSTCTRAAAIVRNRLRFSQDDFPGADALGGAA